MRLNYFDYFRAIAIVLIVAVHCITPWHINTLPEMVVGNLIAGGSALFVFISGFFFHYVFYPRFRFGSFIGKKSRNVFLPYVIHSSCAFFLLVIFLDQPSPFICGEPDHLSGVIELYGRYLWSGQSMIPYWYIPFIMIIFIMSPIFVWFIELSPKLQVIILACLLVCSMFVHRPVHNLDPLHAVVYFASIYMLGMFVSINETAVSAFIENKAALLGGTTLLLSFVQVFADEGFGNFFKDSIFLYAGIDILIIQKVSMIFFFLSLLQKIDGKEIKSLKFIAAASFAIYFLHPWVILGWSYFSVTDYLLFLPGMFIFVIKTIMVITVSVIIAFLFRRLFGRKSRMVIGW